MNYYKKNQSFEDSMIIDQGHTIMANHIPKSIDPLTFNENFYKWSKVSPESVAQFGFFSDIDYNTYYPDLSLDDLKPKDDEFIEPVFRLISETIVSKNWMPTDFSKNGVLKASMKLMLGQTVNCDHETSIGNAIGSVSQVMWQEGYTDGKFKIPAGINGVLKIDGKSNPRIARGILMEPPSIHSNSVTVQFRWDKSHPELDDREFWEKLGTYDSKGNLICRIVTEVIRYAETSLVSHGADPYAQKIGDNGKIVNPTYANRVYNSYKEYMDEPKHYSYEDYKTCPYNDDTQGYNKENNINQNKNDMKEELQQFLDRIFGNKGLIKLNDSEDGKINLEEAYNSISSLVEKCSNLESDNSNLRTEKVTLSEKITNLEAQVKSLEKYSEVGKNYITELRDTTIANYKKLYPSEETVDQSIVKMLSAETTGVETLVALNKDYTSRLEEKFPLTCSKCGSHDISRASSRKEGEDKNDETQNHEEFNAETLYRSKI